LSIGSLPRASARLTTTRWTPRARTIDGHDRRNVLDCPDDPGVENRGANHRRIGIDEPDNLYAELLAPLEDLPCERHGGRAGANQQQPLAWRNLPRQPFERHTPPDHQRQDEKSGHHENAAPDDEGRKPEVDRGQDDRRGAKRLDDTDEQFPPVRHDPQVVQIGVVQTELGDARDEQRLPKSALEPENVPRHVAEPHISRRAHGSDDQQRLEDDERYRSAGEASHQEADHERRPVAKALVRCAAGANIVESANSGETALNACSAAREAIP
jgi:hypothetical protein